MTDSGFPSPPPASLRLSIDTANLAANWRTLDALSGSADAGAAVKADCYGLGVDRCVPVLRDAGCALFFVAHPGEAVALLHHVSAPSIRVLHGPITPADAAFMQQTGIMPVINSVAQAKLWIEAGGAACDLMVDTGINRLGIRADDLSDPALRALQVDFLHSHLACADEDSSRNADQLRLFCEVSGQIAHKRRALANSAGIMLGADYHFDATRPGLSLYGGRPRDGMDQIAQVAFPQAAILQRKQVREGEAVGYNATFTAPRDMIIAVISIGYADGYLRCWSGKGEVMANGSRLPVLGRVSMDMICVDITQAPDLREGDWVDLPWDLPDTAHRSGLSQYELLTTLGHRFDRTNRMK